MDRLHIEARRWKDTVNGNTYQSAVAIVDRERKILVPAQDGQSYNAYQEHTLDVLIAEGLLTERFWWTGGRKTLYQTCLDEQITLTFFSRDVASLSEVVAWAEPTE